MLILLIFWKISLIDITYNIVLKFWSTANIKIHLNNHFFISGNYSGTQYYYSVLCPNHFNIRSTSMILTIQTTPCTINRWYHAIMHDTENRCSRGSLTFFSQYKCLFCWDLFACSVGHLYCIKLALYWDQNNAWFLWVRGENLTISLLHHTFYWWLCFQ